MNVSVPDFFRRVIPWPDKTNPVGFVNLHWTRPKNDKGEDQKGMGGRPFQKLEDFLSMIPWCMEHPNYIKDIYYCLSLQEKVGAIIQGKAYAHRSAASALAIKSLYVDLDIKDKGYGSKAEALAALAAAQKAESLPPVSALVDSGGGIHVYWIFNRPLTIEEWQPYANGLRAALERQGVKCDFGITTDCARVLRVPGTWNKKQETPRQVRLLSLAPQEADYDPHAFDHIKGSATPRAISRPSTVSNLILFEVEPGLPPITDLDYLQEIKCTEDYPPIDPRVIISKCPFLYDALKTGGWDHDQGLWMLTGLACTFMENGRKVFHALSEKHPTYDVGTVDAMFDRKAAEGLGWPSCAKIAQFGAKQCASCKYKGLIQSPLNLVNFDLHPQPPPPPFESGPLAPPEVVADLKLPQGYFVNKGRICQNIDRPLANGNVIPQTIYLFKCVLSNPWLELKKGLHFTASVENGKTVEVLIYDDALSTLSVRHQLERQRVMYKEKHATEVVDFMTSWIEKFRAETIAIETESYGWFVDENKELRWAYAGKAYGPKDVRAASVSDPRLAAYYSPKGLLDRWMEALKLITDQKRPDLEALVVAASFASPLMRFTGQHAAVLCTRGTTAVNKSTAISVGLSVWGHPQFTKQKGSTTEKSATQASADVHNLPMVWDDMSSKALIKRVVQVMAITTEGGQGGKLNRDGSQREVGTWQMTMVVATNNSMFDAIAEETRDNIAQVSRVLEYTLSNPRVVQYPGRIDDNLASMMIQDLDDNYGHMGLKYSMMLGESSSDIELMMKAEYAALKQRIAEYPAERFWRALHCSICVGAKLANMLGCTFDVPALTAFMDKIYLEMRERVQKEHLDSSDEESIDVVLEQFYKAHSANVLRVASAAKQGRWNKVQVRSQPTSHDHTVHIQWAIEQRLLRISKTCLQKWLRDENYVVSEIISQLKKNYNAKEIQVHMTVGTGIDGGREWVLQMPVKTGTWMEDEMDGGTPLVDMSAIRSGPQGDSPHGFSTDDKPPPQGPDQTN